MKSSDLRIKVVQICIISSFVLSKFEAILNIWVCYSFYNYKLLYHLYIFLVFIGFYCSSSRNKPYAILSDL